jgi:tRNA(Ile)-lysidine synthase
MRAQSLHALIQHHLVASISDKNTMYIAAISGGCDSMVLLDLCFKNNIRCVVAHVNYGLRGADSDADEQVVIDYCNSHNIAYEVLRVDEKEWASHEGSTQEIARTLRYQWFQELLEKHRAIRVLTAHHANDQTETMLMQFIRGGSGKSVYGMAQDTGVVLRPLLSATQADLESYAKENNVPWREDLSNQKDQYTRNQLRHHVIPLIESINPSIHKTIQQRSAWMHEEQLLVELTLEEKLKSMVWVNGSAHLLDTTAIKNIPYRHILLWQWLKPFGFSSEVVGDIARKTLTPTETEPCWFASHTHEICIQRDTIALIEKQKAEPFVIDALPWSNQSISLSTCPHSEVQFGHDAEVQFLDASRIAFPLIVRAWQEGDSFKPLGAPGRQKVSDFLTHTKIPAWKKKHVRVMESNGQIVAVLGQRISNDFKITDQSATCLRISFG